MPLLLEASAVGPAVNAAILDRRETCAVDRGAKTSYETFLDGFLGVIVVVDMVNPHRTTGQSTQMPETKEKYKRPDWLFAGCQYSSHGEHQEQRAKPER